MNESKTVLVVDDSALSRALIISIVKDKFPAWRVLEAANAEIALQLNEPSIDVITLDMNMPGMDGISLGRELKQRYPRASISLVTANIQNDVKEKAKTEGLHFVAKPISEENILQAVEFDALD